MTDKWYFDQNGLPHMEYDHVQSFIFREVMRHHMDVCYAAGFDAVQAANILLNGAAYLLGAYLSEQPEPRKKYTEEMVEVFRAKVEQSVAEGRADRQARNQSDNSN